MIIENQACTRVSSKSWRVPRHHHSLPYVYHNIGPLMLQLIESGPSAKIGGVIIFKFMSAVNILYRGNMATLSLITFPGMADM